MDETGTFCIAETRSSRVWKCCEGWRSDPKWLQKGWEQLLHGPTRTILHANNSDVKTGKGCLKTAGKILRYFLLTQKTDSSHAKPILPTANDGERLVSVMQHWKGASWVGGTLVVSCDSKVSGLWECLGRFLALGFIGSKHHFIVFPWCRQCTLVYWLEWTRVASVTSWDAHRSLLTSRQIAKLIWRST